jgi:glycosyltransferase involved in cell wall biosynthesis
MSLLKLNAHKNRILFLTQLPPPVHGVSVINQMFVNNVALNKEFDIKVINLSVANTLSGIGKISLLKLTKTIGLFASLIYQLLFNRPHLVYVTFAPSGPALLRDSVLCLITKLFFVRVLIHMHGKGLDKIPHASLKFLIAKLVFRNALVICLSPGLSADLNHFKPKKIFVLANGIIDDPVQPKPEISTSINLLYLSNLVKTKGILDLLDALEIVSHQYKNWKLHVVGNEADLSVKEITEIINNKKLQNNISVKGPLYGKDKSDQLSWADVLIFPTYNDCFPLVILEAMQHGLLIITTKEGALPEILTNGETGFIHDQRNIEQLVSHLTRLFESPAIIRQIGVQAQHEFKGKYTASIMNEKFIQIIQSILLQ